MSEYQNIKNIFSKGYTQNWSEEDFVISKIKDTVPWTYVISNLNSEPIAGTFYEKELQKTNKQKKQKKNKTNIEPKKQLKEKVINCTLNGKDSIIHLIVGLIKKTLYENVSILS